MKRILLHPLVLVGSLVGGCSTRSIDDGAVATGESGTSDGEAPETTDNVSETGVIEPCPEGTERCGDTCSSLRDDAFNCGECGRECPLAPYSPASCDFWGECEPASGPCVHPGDGIPNCEALCNTVGQHCARARHSIWFSSDPDASCDHKTTATSAYDAACDDPFAWDKIGGFGDPAVAARCICTNNP